MKRYLPNISRNEATWQIIATSIALCSQGVLSPVSPMWWETATPDSSIASQTPFIALLP